MYDIHNLTKVQIAYINKNIKNRGIFINKIRLGDSTKWTNILTIYTQHHNMINIYKNNENNIFEAQDVVAKGWFQVPVACNTLIGKIQNAEKCLRYSSSFLGTPHKSLVSISY